MNLLITGAWRCTPEQKAAIEALGHQVRFQPEERAPLSVPEDWVEGVVCLDFFSNHAVEKLPNLCYIQQISAGLDRLPLDKIRARGIKLNNARGVYSVPMAEFALGGVLQLYKQSRFFWDNQRKSAWEKHRSLEELFGKRVCILGCGSIGTECARRFAAFGCTVTGVARTGRDAEFYEHIYPVEALDTILPETDILVLALPLTAQSRHIIGKDPLAMLKPGAILVNLARGPVVDTAALLDWLRAGKGRAVLDVFEEEPLPSDSPLWSLENAILTPHNSFISEGNGDRLWNLIYTNLKANREV